MYKTQNLLLLAITFCFAACKQESEQELKPETSSKITIGQVSDAAPASIPSGCIAAYMFNYNTDPVDQTGICRGVKRLTLKRTGGATTEYNTISWGYGLNGIKPNSFYNLGDNNAYSAPAGGVMTISVWMMPVSAGVLTTGRPYPVMLFESTEQTGYVHWMGKGRIDQQEWAFRIYSGNNTDDPNRNNRMSFYHWASTGGKGPGCYIEEEVKTNKWIHLVTIIDRVNHTFEYYKNGMPRDTVNYTNTSYAIQDSEIRNGTAGLQLGSKDGSSFFKGAIDNLFIYHRRLSPAEIQQLYADKTP